MKFLVGDTEHGLPCPNAKLGAYIRIDARTFSTPEAYHKRTGKDWFAEGGNHRIKDGGITRDFDDAAWFIEIQDLDALLDFITQNGGFVSIADHYLSTPIWHIELNPDF